MNVLGAIERQAKIQENITLIARHEGNISRIARTLGVDRGLIYDWMRGGIPKLPALIFLIEEWADGIRQQQSPRPPAS